MKSRSLIQLFFLISLIMLSGSGSVQANNDDTSAFQTSQLSVSEQGVQFQVSIPWKDLKLEPVNQNNTEYLQVSLPSGSKTATPGAPELPLFTETIGVPFGVTLEIIVTPGKSHTQELSSSILPVAYQIPEWPLPVADEMQISLPNINKVVEKDPEFYAMDEAYPGHFGEISNIGVIRQQRVAGINLYPIQYHPLTNDLTIYESLHVSITFQGEGESTRSTAEESSLNNESPYYESLLSHALMNYQESQTWRVQVTDQNNLSLENNEGDDSNSRATPWSPPDPGWRIKVQEDGFYQLTYDELSAAGLDVETLDPQTFQLFHMGTQVAIQVDGETDNGFNPEDTILFYGQSIESKYTSDNIYWLTYGSELGLRMTPPRDVSPGSADPTESFPATFYREENSKYWSKVPGSDEFERFLWEDFYASIYGSTAPWIYNFNLKNPSDGSGYLDLALVGYTDSPTIDPDHHAVIEINGVAIDDVAWDGRTWQEIQADIPPGTLIDGNNTLSISLPLDLGAIFDHVYIDWFNLTYQSTFEVSGNAFTFSSIISSPVLFHLTELTTSDLKLYDISDPYNIVQLSGFTINAEDSTFTLDFQEGEDITGEKQYFVGDSSTFKSVLGIEEDIPSDLQSTQNGADYILITHADFSEQAADLAAYRSGQGLRTILVTVQDIYDEFGYGIIGNTPIHDFLAYAYEFWQGDAPSFIVLVGDGQYDPKNFLEFGTTSFIPPYLAVVDPTIGETAADNRYVTFGEDILPDMMIGRLAVNSPEEASAFIEKIIAYENPSSVGDWHNEVLIVADNSDEGGNFPASAQTLISCCLPESYQPERIYLGISHATNIEANQALMDEINTGSLLVNYLGHGTNSLWGDIYVTYDPTTFWYLFNTDHVSALSNEGKYPIFLAMTCYEGYYIDPHPLGSFEEALAEVVTKANSKGAVASWSPTGASLATGHDALNQGFFNAAFINLSKTIGEATTSAKISLWSSGSNLDLIDTYLLFGDPATNFQSALKFFIPLILK